MAGVRTSLGEGENQLERRGGKEGLSEEGAREGKQIRTPRERRGVSRSRAGRCLLLLPSAPPRAPGGGGDGWRPGPPALGTSGSRPASQPAPRPRPPRPSWPQLLGPQPAPFPCRTPRRPGFLTGFTQQPSPSRSCLHTLKSTQT